jgi:hypothetical protein
VDSDPYETVPAVCNTLESVCKAIIEKRGSSCSKFKTLHLIIGGLRSDLDGLGAADMGNKEAAHDIIYYGVASALLAKSHIGPFP